MREEVVERLRAKMPEQVFINVLEEEFGFAPRVADVILAEAKAHLFGEPRQLGPGQMRVVLAKRGASHGRPLQETEKVEVVWTVDAGEEDQEVAMKEGQQAVRRMRLQRLLDEALLQGAVATQEDLAQVLQVSVRTIKRDCAALAAAGVALPTRGSLQGIGRGQTHKAGIVAGWLAGETYDQIRQHSRHSLPSIQRYIQAFVRVVHLYEKGCTAEELALLLPLSRSLVNEYLALYEAQDTPLARQRLADHRQRIGREPVGRKKGGR